MNIHDLLEVSEIDCIFLKSENKLGTVPARKEAIRVCLALDVDVIIEFPGGGCAEGKTQRFHVRVNRIMESIEDIGGEPVEPEGFKNCNSCEYNGAIGAASDERMCLRCASPEYSNWSPIKTMERAGAVDGFG